MHHTADSYAFRVSLAAEPERPGLVYSGDCGRASDLAPLIRPGDDLLVEVSFGLGPVPPGAEHLDAPAIIALAQATRPGRILLTHIQMGHDPAATADAVASGFGGPASDRRAGLRNHDRRLNRPGRKQTGRPSRGAPRPGLGDPRLGPAVTPAG